MSCANIPTGYYLPHKDDEYTLLTELRHCQEFVRHTISTLDFRFPHIYKTETQKKIMMLAEVN